MTQQQQENPSKQQEQASQKPSSFAQAREKKDAAVGVARELKMKNSNRIGEFKELSAQAALEKKSRDTIHAQLKILREQKSKALEKLVPEKKAFFDALNQLKKMEKTLPLSVAQKKMEQAEWQLQTEATNPAKEKKLSAQVRELEKEVKLSESREAFSKQATLHKTRLDALSKEANELSQKITELSKKASSHHEKMLAAHKKANDTSKKISTAFQELDVARAQAAQENEYYREFLKQKQEEELESAQKHAQEDQARRQEKDSRKNAEKNALQERAQKVYEQFKAGKALSREDLLLLQQAGIL